MILWIDAELSPALARWMSETFGVTARAVRDLALRDAKDLAIFQAAREGAAREEERAYYHGLSSKSR